MASPKFKLQAWQRAQSVRQQELDRINFLRTAALPQNPPHLMTETKVRCLRSFCVAGQPLQPGEIVSLPYHLAMDMKALQKIEFID